MDFMALTHLVYKNEDPYIRQANHVVSQRYKVLMDTLGLPVDNQTANAKYYTLIDIQDLCTRNYDKNFANWIKENITDLEFLNDLAARKGLVLMYGPGFKAPEGTIRISLANLYEKDYKELGKRLFELLDEYYEEYNGEQTVPDAA